MFVQAERLYALLNTKCFSRALPPKPHLVFEDPNPIIAAGGTLQKASSPAAVLAAHAANIGDFRRPPTIYVSLQLTIWGAWPCCWTQGTLTQCLFKPYLLLHVASACHSLHVLLCGP